MDRLARRLELVHRRPRCCCCSRCWRPAPSCCGSGSRRSLVGRDLARRRLVAGRTQFIAFAVFAIAAIPAVAAFARKVEPPTDQPFLNRRADGFVGRVFTLDKPIVDGIGTIGIDDTVWRSAAPTARPAAGSRSRRRRRRAVEPRSWSGQRRVSAGAHARCADAYRFAITPRRRAADRACARCRPACRASTTNSAVHLRSS